MNDAHVPGWSKPTLRIEFYIRERTVPPGDYDTGTWEDTAVFDNADNAVSAAKIRKNPCYVLRRMVIEEQILWKNER